MKWSVVEGLRWKSPRPLMLRSPRGLIRIPSGTLASRRTHCHLHSAPVPVAARSGAVAHFAVLGAGGRKTTGASAGTLNGVADFGSESNFENVPGLSLKCFSRAVTRVVLAG